MTDRVLRRAAELAGAWLETLPERAAGAAGEPDGLRSPLPEQGDDAVGVIEALAAAAAPGLVASAGPRYFGFVTGGALPAALGADWLTSAWDQNAALHVMSPAAAAAEETVATWVKELLGLPAGAGVGLVTGAQMANFTALAAARNAVLAGAGWDVEERGLIDAPALRVVTSAESHATVFNALRLLGLGRETAVRVPTDDQGRMRADALAAALAAGDGPAIVCAQAGDVNTGAFDPLEEIVATCHAAGAWCHVDGAFGLWAAVAPSRAHLTAGAAGADSWAVDAHKWLNVPYESALAIVADPAPLAAAMTLTAAYLTTAGTHERNGADWAPEASRRARAFPLYAAIRQLGRRGLAELVERDCALTARIAERLAGEPGVAILNEVVLNQALVRFGGDDAATEAVIARVQREGTCWLGGTVWHGMAAMRISVSGWQTSEGDADRSANAIAAAWRERRPNGV
ncbi:MAG TPA: aminotransferase class V-fold PLP-dependent enzyme [Solirubrobacteraceae bacterium]|nr:aminotransferase class V-fold PLP-dependent enzyme [Solirubrobacteraceae bacterium]